MLHKKILVINGPNLNLLGTREPNIYGIHTLKDIEEDCLKIAISFNTPIEFKQSNIEGEIVNFIQQSIKDKTTDIIINAGAYSHTSIAILDALVATNANIYEIHISNLFTREDFRHKSYISSIAKGVVCGMGWQGYGIIVNYICKN